MIIGVGMMKGKFFLPCHKECKVEALFPGTKLELKWCSCGYEVSYDLTKADRSKDMKDIIKGHEK